MTKFFAGLLALTVAIPGIANAATGNLSGTYSLSYTTLCQSIDNEVFTTVGGGTTDQDQQTVINTINSGKISQTIGVIVFTPSSAGALSGKFAARFTQSNGSLTILGMPGPSGTPAAPDMAIATDKKNRTGSYSITLGSGLAPSTFILTATGGSPITFTAYPSQLKSGIYYHLNFIDIDGQTGQTPSCSNSGIADHL